MLYFRAWSGQATVSLLRHMKHTKMIIAYQLNVELVIFTYIFLKTLGWGDSSGRILIANLQTDIKLIAGLGQIYLKQDQIEHTI